MVNLLPAVLIGGPPQIDTSVLFYSLTKALDERHVAHHALRVYTASEETRFPTQKQTNVRLLSVQNTCNGELFNHLGKELSQRLLPTLIDLNTDHIHLQSSILRHCSHFILLLSGSEEDQENKAFWLRLGERYGLLPLAFVYSSFEQNVLISKSHIPMFSETALSLGQSLPERETVFDFLVERVANLFSIDSPADLLRIQLRAAPGELPLDLSTLLHTVAPNLESWEPQTLSALLEYIPVHVSLSVYGQGPQWLYGALAAHTHADEFYQFSPSSLPGGMSPGWVASPPLLLNTTTKPEIHVTCIEEGESCRLTVEIVDPTLDYLQATSFPFPRVPSHLGLVLAGTMPTWLLTALIRLYARTGVAWIACSQAQQPGAIVIFSRSVHRVVGEVISTLS